MRRRIVLMGEEILRQKAKPVKVVDASVRRLIDDLTETMHAADGLGLAAPQIGVGRRVFVARDGDRLYALVNPQIVARRGKEVGVEGCLSMPGLQGNVQRAKEVTIRGLDRAGREVQYEVSGLTARCFQHEFDHLNGVLYVDHTKDLWWLEEAEQGAKVELPEGDEEADHFEDEDGRRVIVVRVPTTLAEAEAWFHEEIAAHRRGESVE